VADIRLLDRMQGALRSRHYSRRTEQAYCLWAKRYILFHGGVHPAEMGDSEVNEYLTYLAVNEKVASSTQNQALAGIKFLYRHVLLKPLGDVEPVIHARKPRHLPVVMTRQEVKAVLGALHGDEWLMAALMYGTGMRLMECLRLRVLDIDFAENQLTIRDGKGGKDRVTMLPQSLKQPLHVHLKRVSELHTKDLADGWGRVELPNSLSRKYPNAAAEWGWQWVFPQQNRWRDSATGRQGRHHVHPTILQRAVRSASRQAGVVKHVGCHTFRHSFATHLLDGGYDIRTIQELLGHKDVKTTMVYTHVLNRGGHGVSSPIDGL